jgi:pimeloyl-ACP methyl ester carboxylesterase
VGGHGLGGRVAAEFADSHPEVKGLALWAARPRAPLLRTELRVVSVYGTADEATQQEVLDSQAYLPPSTTYVPVPGAVHASFGDYQAQRGESVPGPDAAAAQEQIRGATAALLAAVKPPPPKKKK